MQNPQVARHPLTSDAYFETGTKSCSYELAVHAGMLKIKHSQQPGMAQFGQTLGGRRGVVKGLSRASRKRMIETLASIRQPGSLLFMTLTYPDLFPADSAVWHRNFEAFRDRFENNYPNWRAMWRIETMERKSGDKTGEVAPHWHLIVFVPQMEQSALEALATVAQDEIRQHWYEIVASGDEKHLEHGADVAPVRSIRHAMKYVSKYVAKTSLDGMQIGRRWGRIGQFDTSESIKVSLTLNEYVAFKRLVKQWMRKRRGKFAKKFARLSPSKGCAVFGMGDTGAADWLSFVFEAIRQVADQRERERSHGT